MFVDLSIYMDDVQQLTACLHVSIFSTQINLKLNMQHRIKINCVSVYSISQIYCLKKIKILFIPLDSLLLKGATGYILVGGGGMAGVMFPDY